MLGQCFVVAGKGGPIQGYGKTGLKRLAEGKTLQKIRKEELLKWYFGNAQLFRLARSGTQALCASLFLQQE